jgi:hypothetical protein
MSIMSASEDERNDTGPGKNPNDANAKNLTPDWLLKSPSI